MIRLSVKVDVARVRSTAAGMRKQVNKAAARAINRAIDTARITGGREVSSATKIKVRDVRARMSINGASPSNLVATLTAHPYAPNLSNFRATENKAGVAATAWEGRKTYTHAFILPRTGKVVTRTTNARTPLKGLRGPSVPRTFMREAILDKIESASRERFNREFEREVTRRLSR
jgi:DNA-binding protein